MKLSQKTFYDKVMGCWMGKNIGGTLGAPMEWHRQVNNVDFYTNDLNGDPIPNDDLDLQLIWLYCIEQYGPKVNARDLAEFWLDFQIANYSEYGLAKANLQAGFMPPLSGTIGNNFKDSCGAFIRSELWACLCPGRPDLAVQYAYEDAIVDHGNGEGTYATLFSAAMEAAAFAESDFKKLIEIGLSYIPKDCGVAKAVQTVIDCYEKGLDWKECREEIMKKHRGSVYYNCYRYISGEDLKKGYDKGELGYCVPSNIAIIVAGMLYGEGDFDKTLCTAVNMGEDTDCTAGTVGAIFGIIYGYKNIPERWIEPIGHSIKTICCNKAHDPVFPETLEALTDRVIKQAILFSIFHDGKRKLKTIDLLSNEDDLSDYSFDKMLLQNTELNMRRDVILSMNGPRYDHHLFSVALDYSKTYVETEGETDISLLMTPMTWSYPFHMNIEWISEDLEVKPQKEYTVPFWPEGIRPSEKITFTVSPIVPKKRYEATIKITIPGRHTQMFIPVILQSYKLPPANPPIIL